ncbi:hypothetical protein EWM64_g7432 [Hericium alpestre]|uniref:Uncharacterized protein n=1 Tax=Hericium alpestre TaxID=135208 RepID=A0A4Y9ZNX5_9AGAM|nr:hypothetical protein EWM64_g7432 [Hericium alpestre]
MATANQYGWAEVAYRVDQVPVDRIVRGNLAQPLVVRGGILTIERRTFVGDSWVPIPADLDARTPSGIDKGTSLDQVPDEIEEGERAGAQTHEDPVRQAKLEARRNRWLEKKKMEDEEATAAARRRAPRRTVEHVRQDWLMKLDDDDGEAGWQGRQDDTTGEEGDGKAKQVRKILKSLTERLGPP